MSTDVQSQAAGAARDDARPALHELEAALLELPGVAECAVVRRSGGQGAPVAYVVSSGGPFSRSRAEGLLAERWPGLAPLEALVLVSRLPLRGDGALDEEALAAIPIVDEALAAQLEAALAADARIARAVVFADEIPRKPKALHVDALLSQALKAPLEKPAEARAPGASKDTGAAAPEVRFEPPSDLPLAVCIGEPLRRAADRTGTLPDVLRSAAERVQERRITYLKNDGTTVEQSFAELYAEAARIARGLAERGLVPGDYVILQLAEPSDILSAFWGALIGGFVPAITPVPASYAAETNELERLAHIFRMLNAPACVTTAELSRSIGPLCDTSGLPRERVLELEALRRSEPVESAAARSAHDVAFLMFTSGSTGAPKVISLSHANILTRSEGTNRLCRHEESDRILNWLPFDHIGSISDWHLRCVDLGCHMIYCSKEYVLGEPLNWLRLMDRFRITHSWAPNFAYALVNDALNRADEHFDLRPMKALLTAGEAVSSQTVREFLKRLEAGGLASTALRPAFGMAELGSGVTYFQPTPEHPIRVKHVDRNRLDGALRLVEPDDPQAIAFTSLGPVIPGAGMRIVDEANRPLRELCIGRLQISGGPVMLGYLQNEEANREVFVGDGWFNCGDRGFITDGELYLTGRDKESLIINGANFHNSEIEAAVEEVDGVDVSFTAACAVRPAGATEEHLAIFFSPLPGVGSAQLTSILKRVQNSISRKTGVKPDYLLPVERAVIPKTAIGKIQRKQLVKRFEADEFVELSRQVAVLLEGENTVPDWFLAPVWRVKRVREKSPQRSPRRCLIVGDAAGLARELELLLEQRGYSVERRAALAGAAELAFSHVVDLTHFAAPRAWDAAGLAERAARELVATAAGVAQAAAFVDSARGATNLRYLAVTSGSATVSPDDAVDPVRTMLPGAFKALAQEIERVDCRQLDVPFTSDPQAFTEIARAVADELGHAGDDEEVARRDGKRWVRCFERVSFAGAPAAPLVRGGLYLVTGGLGGVGTMLARQLLGTWGLKLLLVGRAPLESGSPKAAVLAELEALGTVRYRALGGASPRALAELVREVEQDLGVTLSGAFHLAGEYHELPMADETVESLSPVLAAKLDGALALHALLEERPGAFVAAFSSLAGVFSGSGLGAYAVANRFLDSLSHVRRARGQRSYSLNWSVWQGLGIAAAGAPVDLLRSKGYLPISAVPGVRSLVAALGGAPGQLLVGVDTGHARMRRLGGPSENVIGLRGLVVRREVAGDTQPLDGAPAAGVADRFGVAVPSELWPVSALPLTDAGDVDREAALAVLRGTGRAPVAPQTPLQVELVGIWKEVLGVETLGIKETFFDLGGTSLLSVRLFAEIERRLGVRLAPATLFQAPNVEALAELLDGQVTSGGTPGLVELATGSEHGTLFLLHDQRGEVELYRALAERLSPRLRVLGVEPERAERIPALQTRVEPMVSYYVARIRSVQPAGPYLLGGLDAGGVLAFEVACRLRAEGEAVPLLALFDAPERRSPLSSLGLWRDRLDRSLGTLSPSDSPLETARSFAKKAFDASAWFAFDTLRVRLLRRSTDRGEKPPWYVEFIPPEIVSLYAESEPRAARFDGNVVLLRALGAGSASPRDRPVRQRDRDETLGWQARTGGRVQVERVAGGHLTMFEEPHVSALAEQLSRALGACRG